ncbi:TPA: ABC transporter ATP-binding protein [Candidatus Poribacteria bacterium]|nr:ABC transporter ATP-binding protein [Candidatus Poribacteria bacterium]HIM12052.1 ABC transporter ATP-binding protein [Candidatus Poribacteria bacterium]HIO06531.1 ABC transporter ATP-binding protein [Candidatus Poribacteria bacterium]
MSSEVVALHQVVKHFYRKNHPPKNRELSFIQQFTSSFKRQKEVVKAVDGISFQVKLGQIYGILGANGSGKSTLIRLISTLLLPDSGQVNVFGYDVVKDSFRVRQMINRVSVEAAFFKRLSAEENLVYTARLYDIPVKEARRKAEQILSRLGFESRRMHEGMEDLSRGMQQKVAIARALLTSPILLLLDEPTTGLDPKSKRDVQDLINDVRHQHDAVVLLTTHDMIEAEKLCDQVAIIDNGKFIAEGTVKELKSLISQPEATLEDVFIQLTGKDLSEE